MEALSGIVDHFLTAHYFSNHFTSNRKWVLGPEKQKQLGNISLNYLELAQMSSVSTVWIAAF